MPAPLNLMMGAAGGVSLADSGKLYAWGQNGVGQFGNNATSYSNVSVSYTHLTLPTNREV